MIIADGGGPGAAPNAAGQQAAKRPAEAVAAAAAARWANTRSTTRPSTRTPPSQIPIGTITRCSRRDDGAAEVHRAADALEAAVATLVPLNGRLRRAKIRKSIPRRRQSGLGMPAALARR